MFQIYGSLNKTKQNQTKPDQTKIYPLLTFFRMELCNFSLTPRPLLPKRGYGIELVLIKIFRVALLLQLFIVQRKLYFLISPYPTIQLL